MKIGLLTQWYSPEPGPAIVPGALWISAALPSTAQLLAWVDAGRVVNTVQQNLLLAGRVQSLGLAHPALRWTGPDRITTGIALNQQTQHGVVSYRVDALNLPVFAGFLPMPH